MNYETAKLRQFINQHFGPQDLNDLLFDYFRSVHKDLTPGMTKRQQISLLLEFCVRQNQMQNLLAAVGKMRPFFQPDNYVSNTFFHPKTGKEFVRVPEGEFLYGDNKKKLHLDEFWISKTPVTNAEYKRFLDANPKHDVPFREGDWAKPYNWDKQRRTFSQGKADHPVVLVSWHDAKVYGLWAGLDLPTEEQWEKAARSTDGREYPWGNEWRENHCNTSESGIKKTTPVGQFSPQGDSPFGCVDMAGNVWEWTANEWSPGSASRALRGGSWDFNQRGARVEDRNFSDPDYAYDSIGFRLVAPISSGF